MDKSGYQIGLIIEDLPKTFTKKLLDTSIYRRKTKDVVSKTKDLYPGQQKM